MDKFDAAVLVGFCLIMWAISWVAVPLTTDYWNFDECDSEFGLPKCVKTCDWEDTGRMTSRYSMRNLSLALCVTAVPSVLWASVVLLTFYPSLRPSRKTWVRLGWMALASGGLMLLRPWLPLEWQLVEDWPYPSSSGSLPEELAVEICVMVCLLFAASFTVEGLHRRYARQLPLRERLADHDWPHDTPGAWDGLGRGG